VEDLKARTALVNKEKPDLVVSIHQNSYHEESVSGAQVFYYTDSEQSKRAAELIQEALQEMDPENTKQAKGNNTYYILKKTEVPVVITECGFLSNYEEADKLADGEYQQELAEAVVKGILRYLEMDE
jgi:N-acetylmuramoyl-L-alanine amidase